MLLLGVLLVLCCGQRAAGRVTGVWTDIESHEEIVGDYLRNATAEAHKSQLRFAVDAQVGWAIEQNTVDPQRPVHEQVCSHHPHHRHALCCLSTSPSGRSIFPTSREPAGASRR